MALRAWDVTAVRERPRPQLELVGPPPRRPRPVAAAIFVLLLAGLLGLPAVRAATADPPPLPSYEPRPLPAAGIWRLDDIRPAPRPLRPRSDEPVAGILFVRCTRLWRALPDGSQARKLIEMPGISSPTFSPDGRTIAFLADGTGGQDIWLAAADGTRLRKLGALTLDGFPVPAQATSLAWSPNSRDLAFALTDPTYGPLAGGSAVWLLDLNEGSFERVAAAWPTPFWAGRRLAYAVPTDDAVDFSTPGESRRTMKSLSSPSMDLAAARTLADWSGVYKKGAVMLRRGEAGELELAFRHTYGGRDRLVTGPPPGYRFSERAQPAIAQDGSRVLIDLLDPGAGRDLGLFDVESETWTVLDYAWDPAASPVPAIEGPPDARLAANAANDLIWNWDGRKAGMLSAQPGFRHLLPWNGINAIFRPPVEADEGYDVSAVVFGKSRGVTSFRSLIVRVRHDRERLTATPYADGEARSVETIDDAVAFVEEVLQREVPAPAGLPEGAILGRWPLAGWSGRGHTEASIQFKVPSDRKRSSWATVTYGEDLGFSLGCGAENDPEPTEVAGVPAVVDRSGPMNQVIWPATMKKRSAPLSVYGDIPREDILEIAEAMQSQMP